MAISVENFLNRYFNSEQLKEPLDDIGLPVGGTKNQRISRIIENWSSYHRDWYDLLDYLDWETLAKICEDFSIWLSGYEREDTLRNRIANEMILDFRKETMEKIKKKAPKQKSSIFNISGKNVNINSENKIQPTKTSKESNTIPKAQLTVAIIVGFFVILGTIWAITSTENISEESKQEPPNIVTSINQSGGITAGELNIMSKIPDRHISQEFIMDLNKKLSQYENKTIRISSQMGDAEAFQFANEIKNYLVSQNWQVEGVNQAIRDEPFVGQKISLISDDVVSIRISTKE